MQKKIIIAAGSLCLSMFVPLMVLAQTEEADEQNSEPPSEGICSIDGVLIGKPNGRALASAAQYCVQNEQYDKAIKLSRMALKTQCDDSEVHQVFAEALEGKLEEQKDKDPSLFYECIKEWLIVLRQEYGDEKLTYHGLGIPVLGKFYEDEDRVIPARQHLMNLAGSTPKVWETDAKYLKRVTMPGNNKVFGKVLTKNIKTTETPKEE